MVVGIHVVRGENSSEGIGWMRIGIGEADLQVDELAFIVLHDGRKVG